MLGRAPCSLSSLLVSCLYCVSLALPALAMDDTVTRQGCLVVQMRNACSLACVIGSWLQHVVLLLARSAQYTCLLGLFQLLLFSLAVPSVWLQQVMQPHLTALTDPFGACSQAEGGRLSLHHIGAQSRGVRDELQNHCLCRHPRWVPYCCFPAYKAQV